MEATGTQNPGNQAATLWRSPYPAQWAGDTRNSTMFRCCFPTSRGSGLRRARSSNPNPSSRHWGRSHPRSLWPFSRRKPEVPQGCPGRWNPGQAAQVRPVPVCGCVWRNGGDSCVGGACPGRCRLKGLRSLRAAPVHTPGQGGLAGMWTAEQLCPGFFPSPQGNVMSPGWRSVHTHACA